MVSFRFFRILRLGFQKLGNVCLHTRRCFGVFGVSGREGGRARRRRLAGKDLFLCLLFRVTVAAPDWNTARAGVFLLFSSLWRGDPVPLSSNTRMPFFPPRHFVAAAAQARRKQNTRVGVSAGGCVSLSLPPSVLFVSPFLKDGLLASLRCSREWVLKKRKRENPLHCPCRASFCVYVLFFYTLHLYFFIFVLVCSSSFGRFVFLFCCVV